MREVNFSIPNVNKASVGITTALYDRRALDCTSTLPLINSLNHLAYLTTSSARIRDILTVDGGVERLVCILKEGRSKDMMEMWKWNLAFQCVVNIGVRGSENVRTRVVEADMVPVIATILDNYIKVVEKCRENAEAEVKRNAQRTTSLSSNHRSREHRTPSLYNRAERGLSNPEHRSIRRQPPSTIDIPPMPVTAGDNIDASNGDLLTNIASPSERPLFSRSHHHHHHHRSHDDRHSTQTASALGAGRQSTLQPLATTPLALDSAEEFGFRPVRDADRLPSMLPGLHAGVASQPESPSTPLPPVQNDTSTQRAGQHTNTRSRRRPSIRHQRSMSGESDDVNGDEETSDGSTGADPAGEPMVDIQSGVDIPGMEDRDSILGAVETPLGLGAGNPSEAQEPETFNITHRSVMDGSIINPVPNGPDGALVLSPAQTTVARASPALTSDAFARFAVDRTNGSSILSGMPRDEDVLMSLQLLAYVSKYCNLRSYFQRSHLVPKLKIGTEITLLDGESPTPRPADIEEEEEYLLPDDFNIFPLVEKFTVRHHSQDMQYWAGVVMRNLCRKDDSRGGIRQCAYYKCGKWEQYTRQFAKCRRCRRTKYCSKECQKAAWVYHRHWCVAAQP